MNKFLTLLATMALSVSVAFAEDEEEDGPDTRSFVYLDEECIENESDNKSANFASLIYRLNHELTSSGLYRVVTAKDVGRGLKDKELFSAICTKFNKDRELEQPALRVILTVMTYGRTASSGQSLEGVSSSSFQAKVELILRVVDIQTSETKATRNLESSARGGATVSSNMQEQVLQTANKSITEKIVAALVELKPFYVLDVDGKDVTVDVPSNRVRPGQQLSVYKKGKKVKNKRTGKVTASEKQVATIGVVTLGEDSVTCKLLTGEIKPDEEAEEGCEYDKYIVKLGAAASPDPVPPPTHVVNPPASPF